MNNNSFKSFEDLIEEFKEAAIPCLQNRAREDFWDLFSEVFEEQDAKKILRRGIERYGERITDVLLWLVAHAVELKFLKAELSSVTTSRVFANELKKLGGKIKIEKTGKDKTIYYYATFPVKFTNSDSNYLSLGIESAALIVTLEGRKDVWTTDQEKSGERPSID